MHLYTNLKMIKFLLVYLLFVSCGCSQENQQLKDTSSIKFINEDTLIQINEDFKNETRVGTRFIGTEYIDIFNYDVLKNGHNGKNEYRSLASLASVYIDTISDDFGILTAYPLDQHYKEKIIIKSYVRQRPFLEGNPIARKDILNFRILKDLNTNKVEKIVVYIDSVEYILDANNIQKK